MSGKAERHACWTADLAEEVSRFLGATCYERAEVSRLVSYVYEQAFRHGFKHRQEERSLKSFFRMMLPGLIATTITTILVFALFGVSRYPHVTITFGVMIYLLFFGSFLTFYWLQIWLTTLKPDGVEGVSSQSGAVSHPRDSESLAEGK